MSAIRYGLAAALRIAPSMAIAGCVSIYTPLTPDEGYPAIWGPIVRLGPECKEMTGDYENSGTIAVTALSAEPILLTSAFGLPQPARRLSLTVVTHKVDNNGDSWSTLEILPDGNTANRRSLDDCFCVKQTLMCKVSESYRRVPYVSITGSQRNVYLSLAQDGALIAKLQDYDIDVLFAVPVPAFSKTEPWARFLRSAP